MSATVEAMVRVSPTAVIVVVEATLILLAAILVQPFLRRFPAARHALLLLALITVGVSPVVVLVARHAGLPAMIPDRDLPIQILIHQPETVAATQGVETAVPAPFPLSALLLCVWMAGAIFGIVRLILGWQRTRGIRRAAQPVSGNGIARTLDRVATVFDRLAPPVLASESVGVPMAGGCNHPTVLLPASLLPRLGDPELLQVLVHECAHVFRRDTLVKVYQQILSAVLWFHPLVHIANRLLDNAREDVCDNYVLRVAAPDEYSRTLLAIAESFVALPGGLLAPTLIRSAGNLEDRVARLLHPRRCVMTRVKSSTAAIIAATFIGCVLALSSMAASPAGENTANHPSLPYVVTPGPGATSHAADSQGDSIAIESVRGTANKLSVGNTYEVSGTYRLVSHDKALLAIWVTGGSIYGSPKPIMVRDEKGQQYRLAPVNPNDRHRPLPDQHQVVSKGEGHFTLRFHLWGPGGPHVSFYPYRAGEANGSSFASVYFLTEAPPGRVIDRVHGLRK
jgi:beta-lactamase regulating signal transducer with metallopeptidase domain